MPLATDGGDSICITRSIAPMSMPSSRDDVATSPRSVPEFQAVFDFLALRHGDAAVMRANQNFSGQFVDRAGDSFRQAAAVDEDQRRAVRADQFQQFRDESRSRSRGAPDLARPAPLGKGSMSSSSRHVFHGNFDAQIQPLGLAGVDDGDRTINWRNRCRFEFAQRCPPASGSAPYWRARRDDASCGNLSTAQISRDLFQRTLCGGKSDALQLAARQVLQALERKRQMRAALAGNQRVNFVDHHGFDRTQRLARVGGQQQIERLGRGDQNVRRMAQEARALDGGVSPVRMGMEGW